MTYTKQLLLAAIAGSLTALTLCAAADFLYPHAGVCSTDTECMEQCEREGGENCHLLFNEERDS